MVAKDYYINEEIRAKEVRLIDSDGKQIGILPIGEALKKAREASLDLILVAPSEKPPVCKLGDYGRFKYELIKREKEARKASKAGALKEIKLTPKIDDHDLNVRIKKATEFLEKHHKVKLTLTFRGREITHKNIGIDVLNKFVEQLKDKATPEGEIKSEGKNLTLLLIPIKQKTKEGSDVKI